MSIPKLIWLIARYRSWREWQIYDTEANAIDLYQGWVLKEREGGMAGHHLQQHSRWPADDDRCYGGLSHPFRVRTHRSAYNLLLPQVTRQMRRAYANVHKSQAHLPVIMQEKDLRPYEPIPIEYLRAFRDMWKDPGIQKAIERGNEFALHDNLS